MTPPILTARTFLAHAGDLDAGPGLLGWLACSELHEVLNAKARRDGWFENDADAALRCILLDRDDGPQRRPDFVRLCKRIGLPLDDTPGLVLFAEAEATDIVVAHFQRHDHGEAVDAMRRGILQAAREAVSRSGLADEDDVRPAPARRADAIALVYDAVKRGPDRRHIRRVRAATSLLTAARLAASFDGHTP